jgi:hypothetical protein
MARAFAATQRVKDLERFEALYRQRTRPASEPERPAGV